MPGFWTKDVAPAARAGITDIAQCPPALSLEYPVEYPDQ
jgi:hypothetical protein